MLRAPHAPPLPDVTYEPASKYASADLARLLTRAYVGYPMPVVMDAFALEAFCRERSVALERSLVAFREGAPVGLALVARRGRAGYLAEIGLVPEARGGGLGIPFLEAALASLADAGAESCVLEVLENNPPARALYDGAGFRESRVLPCFRTPGLVGRNLDVEEAPLASLRVRVRADAAWPNAFASAERAGARGYASHAGYAVARPTARGVHVFDVGGADAGAVVDGLAALHAGEPASFLNVPDAAVAEALRLRGWERFATQIEMRRPLPA